MLEKKEVLEKCRSILYSYGTGYPIKPQDFMFLTQNIFPLHKQWYEKCQGKRVKAVIVHKHKDYHNLCFALVLDDNSTVDISFTECVNRVGLKGDIQKACKSAVEDIYNPDRKKPIEKTISDWTKGFELGELTVGKFLNYISADQISFSDLALVQSFRDYYQNEGA